MITNSQHIQSCIHPVKVAVGVVDVPYRKGFDRYFESNPEVHIRPVFSREFWSNHTRTDSQWFGLENIIKQPEIHFVSHLSEPVLLGVGLKPKSGTKFIFSFNDVSISCATPKGERISNGQRLTDCRRCEYNR